jgi:signal transduction histidine kinase
MSSKWADTLPAGLGRGLGLRVAVWYAAVFVTSVIVLVALIYWLLSSSLKQRDHEIVVSTLRAYAARYEAGGLPALARAVELEVNSGRHERLFVRVLGPRQNALFYTLPPEWNQFDVDALAPGGPGTGGSGGSGGAGSGSGGSGGGADSWAAARARDRSRNALLEVASVRLWDGTIIQVGKSTEARDELLAYFREVTGFVSLAVILIGVAGGIALTRSTLRPIHHLIDVVRGIIQTGRTETRVPVPVVGGPGVRGPGVPNVPGQHQRADAIDELSSLFNVMLDRITTLIAAMRDSLDNVAHDLRTPMTRLRGMAERALESGTPEAQREALVSCLEESDRILSMLNTLMDISEAETGALRLQLEEVSLRALIAEAVDLYEEVAEDKGITVSVTPGDDVTVSADRDRLRQVFANLLDNALKYTPAGGQVGITLEKRDEGGAVIVRDTGIGITPEDLPRIWDRLYRGDRSRAERGLGLGLSLVRAYVRAHGGHVFAESTPGQGSTFAVLLNRRAGPAPGPGEANLSQM